MSLLPFPFSLFLLPDTRRALFLRQRFIERRQRRNDRRALLRLTASVVALRGGGRCAALFERFAGDDPADLIRVQDLARQQLLGDPIERDAVLLER